MKWTSFSLSCVGRFNFWNQLKRSLSLVKIIECEMKSFRPLGWFERQFYRENECHHRTNSVFYWQKNLDRSMRSSFASFNTPSSLCSRKYVYVKVKFYSVIVSQCHSFVLRTLKLETWNFSDSMIEKNTVTERIYIQNYHFIYNTNYYISFAWFNFQSQCFVLFCFLVSFFIICVWVFVELPQFSRKSHWKLKSMQHVQNNVVMKRNQNKNWIRKHCWITRFFQRF